MAKQIPDLTQLLPADLTADDLLVIRDISAQKDKKIRVGDLTGMPSIGWISALETWTFASFANGIGVVNIPSGGLTKYAVGMKVQFSQATGGKKYAVITGVTNTTLTLVMLLGASLTNESVATPQYSTEAAPPTSDTVDFTSLPTDANGWSARLVGAKRRYYKKGSTGCSVAGSAWTSVVLTNLPVGVTTIGSLIGVGEVSSDDRAITSSFDASSSGAESIIAAVSNQYASTVNSTLKWSIELIEP